VAHKTSARPEAERISRNHRDIPSEGLCLSTSTSQSSYLAFLRIGTHPSERQSAGRISSRHSIGTEISKAYTTCLHLHSPVVCLFHLWYEPHGSSVADIAILAWVDYGISHIDTFLH